jgi:hypothetical protein
VGLADTREPPSNLARDLAPALALASEPTPDAADLTIF